MTCYACRKEGATAQLKYEGVRRPFHPECYSLVQRIAMDVGWVVAEDQPPDPEPPRRPNRTRWDEFDII